MRFTELNSGSQWRSAAVAERALATSSQGEAKCCQRVGRRRAHRANVRRCRRIEAAKLHRDMSSGALSDLPQSISLFVLVRTPRDNSIMLDNSHAPIKPLTRMVIAR